MQGWGAGPSAGEGVPPSDCGRGQGHPWELCTGEAYPSSHTLTARGKDPRGHPRAVPQHRLNPQRLHRGACFLLTVRAG